MGSFVSGSITIVHSRCWQGLLRSSENSMETRGSTFKAGKLVLAAGGRTPFTPVSLSPVIGGWMITDQVSWGVPSEAGVGSQKAAEEEMSPQGRSRDQRLCGGGQGAAVRHQQSQPRGCNGPGCV